MLFAPALALYVLSCPQRRLVRAALMLLPLGLTVAGLGLYDLARFGSPLVTGYSLSNDPSALQDLHPSHTLGSFVGALYGLLVSPGKGVLEYAPPVALVPLGAATLWIRRRAETALLFALILIDLAAHANVLIRWVGGWSWGPRFLMPVLPLMLLLLAPLLGPRQQHGPLARRALLALCALGALVQVPALLLYEPHTYITALQQSDHFGSSMAAMTRLESAYIHQPNLSPILGSWQMLTLLARRAPAPRILPRLVAHGAVTVEPHTWWRLLALQGVPLGLLVTACALLFALAVSATWRAFWLVSAMSADA
jgi:hypothetical protein